MINWDLEEAGILIKKRYGFAQVELARQSMGSTIDRCDYARYHYRAAMTLLDERLGKLHSSPSLVKFFLGGGDENEQEEFHQCISEIGAHVTACIQSLHAIADIFSHAIYYALGYNLAPSPLPEQKITLTSVTKKLGQTAEHNNLAQGLKNLATGDDFAYLNALANHGKHRSLIKPALWLDITDTNREQFTLQFQDFTYKGSSYSRRLIPSFLKGEFDRQSLNVINTGNALNAFLRSIEHSRA